MQPPGDVDRPGPPRRRVGWLVLGLAVLAVGTAWTTRVTYGPSSRWEGPGAAIRYPEPAVYVALVIAAGSFSRAGHTR